MQRFLNLETPSNILIELIGPPGEGKSTSLIKIGHEWHRDFQVFFVNDKTWITNIESDNEKPALILLDSAAKYTDEIVYYASAVSDKFQAGFVLVIAEQDNVWNKNKFDHRGLSNSFENKYNLEIQHTENSLLSIWKSLYSLATTSDQKRDFQKAKGKFTNPNSSILMADRLIDLFMAVGDKDILSNTNIRTDWSLWKSLTQDCTDTLKSLFDNVAWLAQYDTEYPSDFLDEQSYNAFAQVLPRDSEHNPLVMDTQRKSIKLRHKKIAQWYFQVDKNIEANRKSYYETYLLKNFHLEPNIKLFRWLQQNSKFLEDFGKYTPEYRYQIFKQYYDEHNNDLANEQCKKCYFECIKICYTELNQKQKAYEMLDDYQPPDVFSCTLKIGYLTRERRYEEARQCLDSLSEKDSRNEYIVEKKNRLDRQVALSDYRYHDVNAIISEFQNKKLSLSGLEGLWNFFLRNDASKAQSLLDMLYATNRESVLTQNSLLKKYIISLKNRKLYLDAISVYKEANLEEGNYDIHNVICICYVKLGQNYYNDAIALSKRIFKKSPLLIENLNTIRHLVKYAVSAFSENELTEYIDCFDIAIADNIRDKESLSKNERLVIIRLYIGYAQISYRLDNSKRDYDEKNKLREAIRNFPDDEDLKVELINCLNTSEIDYRSIKYEIKELLKSCTDDSIPDFVLRKIEYLYRAKSPRNQEEVERLIAIIEGNPKYADVALIFKIRVLFQKEKYHRVINLIKANYFDNNNYADYEINNLFYYSLFRISYHGDIAFMANVRHNQCYIDKLHENKDYGGNLYFQLCDCVVRRVFEQDPELFEKVQEQIAASILNDRKVSVRFISENVSFLLKTGHLRNVYELLESLKKADGTSFEKNKYLSFIYFSCRMANWNQYAISRRIYTIPKIKPPVAFDVELVAKFIEFFSKYGIKRRLLVYLYLLYKNCDEADKGFLKDTMAAILNEFDGFNEPHAFGVVEKKDGHLFFSNEAQEPRFFNNIDLNKKMEEGGISESYVSIKKGTPGVTNPERAFCLDGDMKNKTGLSFPIWLKTVRKELSL